MGERYLQWVYPGEVPDYERADPAEVLREMGGMEAAICSGCGSVVGRDWAEQPCVLCGGQQRPAFVVVVKEVADG